jgi:hypothetical protein
MASPGHDRPERRSEQNDMMQPTAGHTMDEHGDDRRKGVRRTVTVLVAIVLFFFLISFLQILLMK